MTIYIERGRGKLTPEEQSQLLCPTCTILDHYRLKLQEGLPRLGVLQEGLPRLGVLGLACSDGCLRLMVYVYKNVVMVTYRRLGHFYSPKNVVVLIFAVCSIHDF